MTTDRTALRAVASLADARQRRLEAELEHAICTCPDPVEEWVPSLGRWYCRHCLCGVVG